MSLFKNQYPVRPADVRDIDTLVRFTILEAQEAQGTAVDPAEVRRGVDAGFELPPRARYWVAEDVAEGIVASTSVVTEWSDFRGGEYWWIQSLYIAPTHRGRGLAGLLLAHIGDAASAAQALELRLYVHEGNRRAMRAYERCGFARSPHVIMHRTLPATNPEDRT